MTEALLSHIGLVGLAVMGQNLVLNLCEHGYRVSVYNRTFAKTQEFSARWAPLGRYQILGCAHLKDFVRSLERPRKIILMVKAGSSVDEMISCLVPYLDAGDILIDGGNSHFRDTQRRQDELACKKLHLVGCGISGGEEGARHGPSIMPGGPDVAKASLMPVLSAIAAQDYEGGKCCSWLGPAGSGHFVKMVHNGIEYADMQLICEAYDLIRRGMGARVDQCQKIFEGWKDSCIGSYLIEITANILKHQDVDGEPLIDKILDEAGQKGTGRWTVNEALEQACPLTLIAEAVFARQISAKTQLRHQLYQAYRAEAVPIASQSDQPLEDLIIKQVEQALFTSKLISYAQGFQLLMQASGHYDWGIDLSEVARVWSGGCIIRSRFLKDISQAYQARPQPLDLLLASPFIEPIKQGVEALRKTVALAVNLAIPAPALSSALAYLDALKSPKLPANLLQAQRDYFGAHTYQRIDRDRSEFYHTDWAQTGGVVSSTSYNA